MNADQTGLDKLTTPALLLDQQKMMRNITRLDARAQALGVTLRPHLKTAKSTEISKRVGGGTRGPITVSTLAEAEEFHAAGHKDILYAVGIAPRKLPRVQALRTQGCDLTVILDNVPQAQAVVEAGVPALIEINSDGHRGGLQPDDPELIEIGQLLAGGGMLRGVMTHAGASYSQRGDEKHATYAEVERRAAIDAAQALRAAGLTCPIVSVGSTPTAHGARDLSGVTELRAGVYVFFDLVMAGIDVCTLDDLALSVLTTVIGHQTAKGWIMIDAGWMAMSRDRGTAVQDVDQGYGVVCDEQGRVISDLIVGSANQEHGVITLRPGAAGPLPVFPVGTLLRILPNHACATAAQFDHYNVVEGESGVIDVWPRFRGW
ncbi:alanine racemase [Sulfitobacter sp. F26204]|uniref:alanine racemase n=1 Tax=Sulfitobacter sp. F26204 TaxID=2996014 RepID=UPI00225E15AD|nr:alanine racemase [Sulfitobacter sp. F26204]MCX7561204.1 alanine racemase [Sulfitobacter sp. F26204]